MPKKIKQFIDFTFILKLNKEDRGMLDELQNNGLNASLAFRKYIRVLHSETFKTKNKNDSNKEK